MQLKYRCILCAAAITTMMAQGIKVAHGRSEPNNASPIEHQEPTTTPTVTPVQDDSPESPAAVVARMEAERRFEQRAATVHSCLERIQRLLWPKAEQEAAVRPEPKTAAPKDGIDTATSGSKAPLGQTAVERLARTIGRELEQMEHAFGHLAGLWASEGIDDAVLHEHITGCPLCHAAAYRLATATGAKPPTNNLAPRFTVDGAPYALDKWGYTYPIEIPRRGHLHRAFIFKDGKAFVGTDERPRLYQATPVTKEELSNEGRKAMFRWLDG